MNHWPMMSEEVQIALNFSKAAAATIKLKKEEEIRTQKFCPKIVSSKNFDSGKKMFLGEIKFSFLKRERLQNIFSEFHFPLITYKTGKLGRS